MAIDLFIESDKLEFHIYHVLLIVLFKLHVPLNTCNVIKPFLIIYVKVK